MSIRSSCHHLTISTLWLAAATPAAGCILLNPSYGATGTSATEATGADASTAAEDSTTAGSTTEATTSAETSTTALTTSTTSSGETTGEELCRECASPELACDASLACGLVREIAEDCGYERVCINDQACATLPQEEAAEGLTLWNALARCDAAECMGIPPTTCVAEQEACEANQACVLMNTCVGLQCSCLPDDELLPCWQDCGAAHPAGVEDWQSWLACIDEQGADDGPPTTDARAP